MQTQIKVRGYHLDVYQHVNNARYRSSLRKPAGTAGKQPRVSVDDGENIAFVVVNISINYRRPAVLGDVLTVSSKLEQLNGKSGTLSRGHPQPQWRSSGRCADYLRLYRFENPEGAAAGRGIACET